MSKKKETFADKLAYWVAYGVGYVANAVRKFLKR